MRRIIFLVIVVLLILFIGYSFDNGDLSKKEDIAGKTIELFTKNQQKQQLERQSERQSVSFSFCRESDIITALNTGFNPFERGQIQYKNQEAITKTDHCRNKQILIEYSCDNYQTGSYHKNNEELFSIVDCEFGCDEQFGTCKH